MKVTNLNWYWFALLLVVSFVAALYVGQIVLEKREEKLLAQTQAATEG